MNALPSGQRQIAREDCAVGDWIEMAFIPEWAGLQGRHCFTPSAVSISPESGQLGGTIAEVSRTSWQFEQRADCWVRVA